MSQWKRVLVLSLVGNFLLTACGNNNQFLKSMSLNVSEQTGTSYVNLSAEVDLGNLSLDHLQIPVVDPHNQLEIGHILLSVAPDGKELVTLSMDANSILHGDAMLGSTLPNGRSLPSSLGLSSGSIFAIPVLNYSRVYIGGDLKSSIVLGLALSVQALDKISGSVGVSSNLFFSQVFSPSLSGVAGIYASPIAHQNGIAVFGKYTAPVQAVPLPADPVPTQIKAQLRANSARLATSVAVSTPTAELKAEGVTNVSSGNTLVNEGMSTQDATKLYRYFYGKKRSLRAH